MFILYLVSTVCFTGENFKIVQQEVAKILEGRILIGHAIHNDLKVCCTILNAGWMYIVYKWM